MTCSTISGGVFTFSGSVIPWPIWGWNKSPVVTSVRVTFPCEPAALAGRGRRLAAAGIGLWPTDVRPLAAQTLGPGDVGEAVSALQVELARFGFGAVNTGHYDAATAEIITAFQRHWRPARVSGIADAQTQDLLAALSAASG